MKKLVTAISCVGLAVSLFSGSGVTSASGSKSHSIMIDGKRLTTSYITQGGKVLVPAKLFSKMGVRVNWDSQYQAVIFKKNNIRLSLPSESKNAYRLIGSHWKAEALSTKTKNRRDGTYVPLRDAAEKLGLQVSYNSRYSTISISTGKQISTSNKTDDIYWFYQLIEAEAGGESYKGKVAAAATVLNRVDHPNYPNRLKDVIFQIVKVRGVDYYQYSPVKDGRIYKVKPSEDTIKAVNEALNGTDPTKGAITFYNPDKTNSKWVRNRPVSVTIGNHVFAK